MCNNERDDWGQSNGALDNDVDRYEVYALTKDTSKEGYNEKVAQTKNYNGLISGRCFLICHACFWCASYINIMGNMEDFLYKTCPICNSDKIDSLPI